MNQPQIFDLIIVGAGPAGLTASIYASRYKLSNLVIGKVLGGELSFAHRVCNYPGFMSISGIELGEKWKEQVESLGGKILLKEAGKIEILQSSLRSGTKFESVFESRAKKFERSPSASGRDAVNAKTLSNLSPRRELFKIYVGKDEVYQSKALIVATGSERRRLNIPGEKEYVGKGVSYCYTCLPPGEEVVANGSLKNIEEVGIAQKVLTADGTFQNINQIISRSYMGELVKIKTRFFTEVVRLTTNHPILYTTVQRNYYKKLLTIDEPEWKKAGDLTKKDVLLYPIVTETKDIEKIRFSEILGLEVEKGKVKNDQETHTSLRISDEIPVNEKFLRLVGYYLADGCVTRHGINFYFNKKEKSFVNDVRKLVEETFSLKSNVQNKGGVTRVMIFSKLIKDLFQVLFGKYAPNKKIPHWLLFLPLKKQKEIIKGLYRGDGCLRDKDFCIVTTSRNLAYQIRDILLRFAIIPSIVKREKTKLNKTPGEVGGRKIRFNYDKYHIVIGGASLEVMSKILKIHHPKLDKRKKACRHAWIKGAYLYLPIREIEREYYKGKVFNLFVEKNNTYIAKNFIVHNCDAPFFKDKTVALVGGSDSAVSGAIHTAEYAKKVYIIYRKDKLRAEPIWQEEWQRIEASGKGEAIYNTNITQILGGKEFAKLKAQSAKLKATTKNLKLEEKNQAVGVLLDNPYKREKFLPVEGVFIEIGSVPGTTLVQPLGVELDETGHVIVNEEMETNIPGLFCAGDMVNKSAKFKQAVLAMAQGALAAASAYKFIKQESAPQIKGV